MNSLSLKEHAKAYHKHRFNICPVSDLNENEYDRFKCPIIQWKHFRVNRQIAQEIDAYDWSTATGLGVVLGYENLRAIDVDKCVNKKQRDRLINFFLEMLHLPKDYEWVVHTGSGTGFHLIYYAQPENWKDRITQLAEAKGLELNDRSATASYTDLNIVAFESAIGNDHPASVGEEFSAKSKFRKMRHLEMSLYYLEYQPIFERLEVRSEGFLVLPPSRHITKNSYSFAFNENNRQVPTSKPLEVNNDNLEQLIEFTCVIEGFLGSSEAPGHRSSLTIAKPKGHV